MAFGVRSGICVSACSWLHANAETSVNNTESAIIFSFSQLWVSVFPVVLGARFGMRAAAVAALTVLSAVLFSAASKRKQVK